MSDPILEAHNLSRNFGDFVAVDEVNFTLNPGEIVGFLGPNGAGKTTTIKMLTGLLGPSSGTARVAGFDMAQSPLEAKARIGYVPDTPNLYGKLKAQEYLRFVGQLYKVSPEQVEARIKPMLDVFDLTDVAGNYLDTFSHGMQQKVAIIGAFLHQPQIVFMDEPTVGLDPRSARLIKDLMIRHRDNGGTIFFSTHILEIAQTMCDRVIIINKGRIVADAQVSEMRRMRGDQSLEDIFLELTGGRDVDEMVKELEDGG
ncbi:MAG: ABC transporter ATP-binding protein [Anaerolineae bacterium]|uniref:ABC transporter ATP-binding protein n=1 Tax=Promineifilum sp. TaxID=2664178 RepID=UPI001D7CE5F4|nr:ABC transporter ATP-binding protein [Anaerolineales bacterium]MCB8936063.1 ABC transporter ATP-binding protein [Promineifilum sp.]MCO5181683.1 ABC transporter ATP-binding protein [Promineifilum sp.]MCW5847790.1 ABC transporter ATP-binding protein [Anaerolineae bacterium]